MTPSFDLKPARPLQPANAVAAVIKTNDGRYLLQLRDRINTIFYPDHWGCFGGAIENGELPLNALRRELSEELALNVDQCAVKTFGRFQFSVDAANITALDRIYYEVTLDSSMVSQLRLGEGAALDLVDSHRALHHLRLVPYDAFALWLHCYQGMLVAPGTAPV
jgi:8-oxo-dGTP pyrophosphatase MutT (NUDIX family)